MNARRPLVWVTARCATLAAVVFLVTVPVYVWVEPSWRAVVVRVAAAFVLGVALLELRRAVAERLEDHGSPLDAARGRHRTEPAVPYRFLELTRDVRTALRSRPHFDKVLWPRLTALASRPLVPPPVRRGRGRRLAWLREALDVIEKQP